MSTTIIDTYSDHDMQCPASWENGFKEGIVLRFGDGERTLSDPWTGEYKGATFSLLIADHRRRFRQQLTSDADRYWVHPLTVRMTTRANRAILGIPYTVFVGPIIDIQFPEPLQMELTLGDLVSQALFSDQYLVPWRLIRDGMLGALDADAISETLDLEAPEPIIYGQHRRIPDVDPASPQGFEWTPIYLGLRTVTGTQYHVWMVCGHAVADIPDVNTVDIDGLHTTMIPDEGTDWLIPHYAGYLAAFGTPYEDIRSSTYENDRRYTLIYGKVGEANPDACASGELTLTCFVDGVEPNGDGTGTVITDRIQQYKHFVINYVANRGPQSYQSGAWLTTPTWNVFDIPVEMIDEASFDAATLIAEERLPLPVGSPVPDYAAGYIGAVIIGATSSDRSPVTRWISAWNVSSGLRHGFTHLGQYRVVMLHPTAEIKAAAPLYTDAYEVLKRSFTPGYRWAEKVNRVPYRADYEHRIGSWKTSGIFSWDEAINQYGSEILGETREYLMAPGITAADHLARMEVLQRRHPPRPIVLEATIGPDDNNQSLGYLDLGDYIRYVHFDALADANEIRLAMVERHQVQAGKRRVLIQAIDCEDLIGFDAVPEDAPSTGSNDTCATAIVITPADTVNYTIEINVEAHGDAEVEPPCVGSPAGISHAAWWTYTPDIAQRGHVTTGLSDYDTVLSVWSGSCGSLANEECNDNDGIFQTSFIEFTASNFLQAGVTYKFLVTGYGSLDGGNLVFTFFAEPL